MMTRREPCYLCGVVDEHDDLWGEPVCAECWPLDPFAALPEESVSAERRRLEREARYSHLHRPDGWQTNKGGVR